MKKLAALLALTAVFLSACGNNTSSGDNGTTPSQTSGTVGSEKSADTTQAAKATEDAQEETEITQDSETSEEVKESQPEQIDNATNGILVAYFTAAENGETDAMTSASKLTFWGEDMGNAEAMANVVASYMGGDLFSIQTVKDYPLEYNDLADDAKAEQDNGELPELATSVDISGYDTVFVVYPIWWYTMPQPIYSFLDEYDFSGKTLIPVTTHEGSGLADSVSKFKELEPDATVLDGYSVRGGSVGGSQTDIEDWLKEQGF